MPTFTPVPTFTPIPTPTQTPTPTPTPTPTLTPWDEGLLILAESSCDSEWVVSQALARSRAELGDSPSVVLEIYDDAIQLRRFEDYLLCQATAHVASVGDVLFDYDVWLEEDGEMGGSVNVWHPVPKPERIDLATTTEAPVWVHLENDIYEQLSVYADTSFDVGGFELWVVIVESDKLYCNQLPMHIDADPQLLGCGDLQLPHGSVEFVMVISVLGDFQCLRNIASTNQRSIYACEWV